MITYDPNSDPCLAGQPAWLVQAVANLVNPDAVAVACKVRSGSVRLVPVGSEHHPLVKAWAEEWAAKYCAEHGMSKYGYPLPELPSPGYSWQDHLDQAEMSFRTRRVLSEAGIFWRQQVLAGLQYSPHFIGRLRGVGKITELEIRTWAFRVQPGGQP